jgi:molecular chaperone GrpE
MPDPDRSRTHGGTVSDDNSTQHDGIDPSAEDADPAAQIEQLRQQLAAAEDRALRVQAEAQNMVRRAERDVENARKFALERFAGSLLPVLDNLERALAAMGEPSEATRALGEGVQLTLKSFLDVLQKFDVQSVDPTGQTFNPELHQAMAMIEQPAVAPKSVVQVMQKGYTLNGRLLRPAMVVVAKPAPRIDETA